MLIDPPQAKKTIHLSTKIGILFQNLLSYLSCRFQTMRPDFLKSILRHSKGRRNCGYHQQDTDSHQESQQIRNEFPLTPRPDQLQNQTPLLSQALFPESF